MTTYTKMLPEHLVRAQEQERGGSWRPHKRGRGENRPPKIPSPEKIARFSNGQLQGHEAEQRFDRLCKERKGEFPPWLRTIRKSTMREEAMKADFVAHTSENRHIFIQVKSSKRGREKFLEDLRYRHVACIAVTQDLSDDQVFAFLLHELADLREIQLKTDQG